MTGKKSRGAKKLALREPKIPSKEVLDRLHALKDKKGMIAVIEPDTGDYYLAKTLTEALNAMVDKYPGKLFFTIRIGYSYVHGHKGGIHKL
jgi:hypothetical protein